MLMTKEQQKPDKILVFGTVFPQLSILIIFILIAHQLPLNQPMLTAAIYYLGTAIFLRLAIPRHHRKGMKLIKNENFPEAIKAFGASYEFFTAHHWLDRHRHLILLSSSAVSYKEMALLNVAYCHGQLGQVKEMKAQYEKVLERFPLSKTANEMMARIKKAEKSKKKKKR